MSRHSEHKVCEVMRKLLGKPSNGHPNDDFVRLAYMVCDSVSEQQFRSVRRAAEAILDEGIDLP